MIHYRFAYVFLFKKKCVGVNYLNHRKDEKSIPNHTVKHIIWREILRWVRIWSQNFDLTYAFWRKSTMKNLRGRISKKIFAIKFVCNSDSYDMHMSWILLISCYDSLKNENYSFCALAPPRVEIWKTKTSGI